MSAGHAFVRVLEEDPELAAGLDPTSVQLATRHAIAAVETVSPGVWEPTPPPEGGAGYLGLLVLDGLLMRDVTFAHAACTELIGRGDLLRPWDWERDVLTIRPVTVSNANPELSGMAVLAGWPRTEVVAVRVVVLS